jgi:hypothetical protein
MDVVELVACGARLQACEPGSKGEQAQFHAVGVDARWLVTWHA